MIRQNIVRKIIHRKSVGYVTIVVLILMLVLSAAAYIYADSVMSELTIARNNRSATIAFSLAEAGIQEAVYRIRNDATTRDTFLHTTNGTTSFSHDPSLLGNGSYAVIIQNTAEGAATISSVSSYNLGGRIARREVHVDIAQATVPPPYNDNGAMFSHSAGGESTGDLEFTNADINIYGGDLQSGRDISFKKGAYNVEGHIVAVRSITEQQNPTVNCQCLIDDDNDPSTTQCSDNPGCTYTFESASNMPMIDFDSSSPNSYKNQAIALNQYYTSQSNFFIETSFGTGQTKTFNGVVYIEGGITIDSNRTMNMNGALATSGSITLGGSQNGILNVSPPGAGKSSGALATGTFTINNKGDFSGTGLIYAGFRTIINASNSPVTFTGGILTRRVLVDSRTVTIHFSQSIINDTLSNPEDTPVIQINHWEEEY